MVGSPEGRRPFGAGLRSRAGSFGGTAQSDGTGAPARIAELERDREQLRRTLAAMERELDALTGREATQRALAEATPTLVLVTDTDGRILHQGTTPDRVLRAAPGSLAGQAAGDLVHPEDRPMLDDALKAVGTSGGRRMLIIRLNRNGLTGPADPRPPVWRTCETMLVNRLDDPVLRGVLIACHDVTPWAEAAARLHTAQRDAERAARAKADLLAIMSHEIRTPLNGVIGTVRLLLATLLDAEQRDYVRTALDSGEMLLTLLNDILDLSKAEAGQMDLESRAIDPRQVMTAVLKLLDGRARARGNRLVADIDPIVPAWITGDPGRLRQVLLNLVDNAVKFTRDGTVTVTVNATPEAVPAGSDAVVLRFSVADTGAGIAPEARQRLFTAFTQADASVSRRHGGTGLGLSVCKALVDQWGGRIGIDSLPGRGSRFHFTLPCRISDPPADADADDTPLIEEEIVVEDDPADTGFPVTAGQAAGGTASDSGAARQLPAPGSPNQLPGNQLPAAFAGAATADQPPAVLPAAGADGHRPAEATTPPQPPVLPAAPAAASPNQPDRPAAAAISAPASPGTTIARPAVATASTASDVPAAAQTVSSTPALPGQTPPGQTTGETVPPRRRSLIRSVIRPAAQPLKVLLVEDNPINQKIGRGLLERMGHKVSIATDGDVAVEAVATGRYDVVLMDIHMPEVDGFEATRRIRAVKDTRRARIPIVAMTADAGRGEADRCKAAGMDDYVAKPVDPEDLRRTLDRQGAAGRARHRPAAPPPPRPVFTAESHRVPHAEDGVFDPEAIDALAAQVGMPGVPALIDEFTRHASKVLQTLQTQLDQDAIADAIRSAHELKGMTLSFGLVGLHSAVLLVETACKAGDVNAARNAAGRLGPAAVEGVSRLRVAYPLRAAARSARNLP